MSSGILRVAVPVPVYHLFDYLPPAGACRVVSPGMRVRVSFGRRRLVGLVMAVASTSDLGKARLKPVLEVLDETPVLDVNTQRLLYWCAAYYHYPVGEVAAAALPARLRQGLAATPALPEIWKITEAGQSVDSKLLARAPRQRQMLLLLREHSSGLSVDAFREHINGWHKPLHSLHKKGLVERCSAEYLNNNGSTTPPGLQLNMAQLQAADTISENLGIYRPILLHGVTGSGKTRVYLRVIEQVVLQGQQALVLVPEIGLTSQLIQRFIEQFNCPVAVMHSALNETDRHRAWHMASSGQAGIILGTRSAVFTPLHNPGLIVVDEEHDTSLKQQDGFRYHARDVAVYRAQQLNIPIILGSATPSLETLNNVQQQKYLCLKLPYRAAEASMPQLEVVDMRNTTCDEGFSHLLIKRIELHLQRNEQILIFLNRRGFAPVLLCHKCGWMASCERCDAKMTIHLGKGVLRCHHCGSQRRIDIQCPECRTPELSNTGLGTERVEATLRRLFPVANIIRIDRDTTRKSGDLDQKLQEVLDGHHQILVGTQMLSKGHNFPNVTLAAILEVDQGFHSADFRGAEHTAQMILQVSGRAGRAQKPGTVLLQTRLPDHPLLRVLIQEGYDGFSQATLREREQAGLPPFGHLALIRAEAVGATAPMQFLQSVRDQLAAGQQQNVNILGPAPALMERRAGRYRAQLLLSSQNRGQLQSFLNIVPAVLDKHPQSRRVRWSLDVDPVSLD